MPPSLVKPPMLAMMPLVGVGCSIVAWCHHHCATHRNTSSSSFFFQTRLQAIENKLLLLLLLAPGTPPDEEALSLSPSLCLSLLSFLFSLLPIPQSTKRIKIPPRSAKPNSREAPTVTPRTSRRRDVRYDSHGAIIMKIPAARPPATTIQCRVFVQYVP
jgi:hypothetical protein